MRLQLLALSILATVLYSHNALAREEVLRQPRGGNVLVWKSGKPHDQAISLLASGVRDPALLTPLLACRVPSGTMAVVTEGGFISSDIIVTSGAQKGCRGTVANEVFAR